MKIWHVGACATPEAVNGVNATVWQLALAQAAARHQVTLLLDEPPTQEARVVALAGGVELVVVPTSRWPFTLPGLSQRLASDPPDVVHLHSVFIPRQAVLCRLLGRARIPYVVTPNGGFSSNVLRRGRAKKALYSLLVEQPRIRRAAAIAAVLPAEEREIRTFVPDYPGVVRWIPNPVPVPAPPQRPRVAGRARPRVTYLGRFDILHKGIDRLMAIARCLPEADFLLYGEQDGRARSCLDGLRIPENVHVHAPVFGAEKMTVLVNADLYIQTSRWEAFGISVAEAMCALLPCAIADTMAMSELFRRHELGLVLPDDPSLAASRIRALLNDRRLMATYADRARAFVAREFEAAVVATAYQRLYRDAIRTSAAPVSAPLAVHPGIADDRRDPSGLE